MQEEKGSGLKRKVLWSFVFVCIVAASIWAVTSQSKTFSVQGFLTYLRQASPLYLCLAIGCMVITVAAEGFAALHILKAFGYPRRKRDGMVYSAADIYFSAITPSATGGQPAAAYFMMKDAIPGAVATVTLLLNLLMYALSMILIGIISFLIRPGVFLHFGTLSKVLIGVGCVIQIGMVAVWSGILRHERLLHRVCSFCLGILSRLHLVRRREHYEEKLAENMAKYRECADMIRGKREMLLSAFLWNLVQRASAVTVVMFAYLSAGGDLSTAVDIWAAQSCVIIGSNFVPIPGAVGVSDYLMLDGFQSIVADPTNLELLSRSLSFYSCVLLCGGLVLVRYIIGKRHEKAKN